MRTTLTLLGMLFACAVSVAGQGPQGGAGAKRATITGIVTHAGTGDPLRDVRVTANGGSGTRTAITDEKGMFAIADLAPGAYSVDASAALFVRSRKRRVNLGPEQNVDLRVPLTPTAVIAGRVYDQTQRPVPSVRVEALRYQYRDGAQTLTLIASGHSDDRGEYRIFNLRPDTYYVRAVPSPLESSSSSESAVAPVYYPGTVDSQDAISVKAAAGTESNAIDIRLGDNRTFLVRFAVAVPDVAGVNFSVVRVDRTTPESIQMQPQSLGGGTYQLSSFSPGVYEIFVRVQSRLSASHVGIFTGRLTANVTNQDIDGGILALRPAAPLKGRFIVSEALTVPLNPASIEINLYPVAGLPLSFSTGSRDQGGSIARDGVFTIPDVANGRYRVEVSGLPENLYLTSARYGGAEVIDGGIDVDGAASGPLDLYLGGPAGVGVIEGTVRGQDGQPAGDSLVVVVPAESRRHNPAAFRTAVADHSGTFSIRGLLPGEYTVLAWDDVEAGVYQNPEFLKDVEPRGVKTSVDRGSRRGVDLRVIP